VRSAFSEYRSLAGWGGGDGPAEDGGVEGLTRMFPEGTEVLWTLSDRRSVDDLYWPITRFCTGKKVFSTKQGMLGLGPTLLREGNLCCLLLSAQVPFILRRFREKFQLVGEAFVHGVMKGRGHLWWTG
jgi:hypothetical protein